MALPKSKYSEPKHTPGKEFTLNGQEYRGWYITTYKGTTYSGKYYDENSKILIPITPPVSEPTYSFIPETVHPSDNDKKAGTWKRYFIQKKANRKIIEVSKPRYLDFSKKSEFNRVELEWKLKGPAENQTINGYVYFGAAHINEVNTKGFENVMPGISSFIKNYSEFVE